MLAHFAPLRSITLKFLPVSLFHPAFSGLGKLLYNFGFFWVLGCTTSITAQDYTVRNIEIDPNGESHRYRNYMQLDEDGFLWYSTHNGLVKDFGTHSVLSSFLDENAENLPKYIRGFFMDSQQRIWISSTTGIFVSSKSLGDSFNRIEFKLFLKGRELKANSYIEDCDGNLWIAAGGPVNNIVLKVDPSLEVTEYQVPGIEPRDSYEKYYLRNFLHFERRIGCDKFLVRQGRKLFILDKGETTLIADFTTTLNYENRVYYHPEWEWEYNGGDGLLITDNGDFLPESIETQYTYEGEIFKTHFIKDLDIQVLNLPLQEMMPLFEDTNPVKNHADLIGIDDNGKLLVLFKMIQVNGSLLLKKTYEIPFPYFIDDVIVDKDGIVYVCSDDHISKIKFSKNSFDRVLDRQMTHEIDLRGFLELPSKEILAATNKGIFKLTPSGDSDSESPFETENVFPSLFFMKSFAKVSDSTAWCLGERRGLWEINFLKNKIEGMHIFNSHWSLPSLHYYDILKSSDSTLLLASHYGLQEFNTRQNKFRELPIPMIENNRELFVWDLHRTEDRFFIGTDANGLVIQDLDSKTFFRLTKDSAHNGLVLPSNKVQSIYIDGQENIWLGTDKGAVYMDKDLKKLSVIDEADGLTNPNVVGVLEDAHKNMWLSTHDGLYRYGKSSKKITAFYVDDGLPFDDFNQISYFKSSSGKLLFGGVNGLIAFDSIDDATQSQEIKIFPTKFEYYDREEKKDVELDVLNRRNYDFNLSHAKNSFAIRYSINDCYDTETNKYAYRLDGVTNGWVDLGDQTTLRLLSIPPGDHILRIKGANPAGIESTNELVYDIHVAQAFHRRTWVQSLAVLLLLGLIALVFDNRNRRERKKHRLHLTLIELEQKTLRAQMNPHFIFNALNNMLHSVRQAKLTKLESYITNFSTLMRQTLHLTRKENIPLEKEILYIENYVALTNSKNVHKIDLKVQYGPYTDAAHTIIPSMMLQPIVENAIVHGFTEGQTEKTLNIKVEKAISTRQLILTVSDNGIGISATEGQKATGSGHESYATQILKERLNLLNQVHEKENNGYEIALKDLGNGTRTGTEVTIKIPY